MLAIEHQLASTTTPIIEPILQVNEIQGNSLGGFQKDHEMLMFLKITNVAIAKKWLQSLTP